MGSDSPLSLEPSQQEPELAGRKSGSRRTADRKSGSGSWRTAAMLLLGSAIIVGSFTTVSGIKCWECNSAYDKRCGDPFESFTSELVDCDQKNADMKHLSYPNGTIPKASICRKTVQIVNEETRVIRTCGWLENPPSMKDRECFTRTGTNQVMVYHCACYQDACNSASSLQTSLMVLTSFLFLAYAML